MTLGLKAPLALLQAKAVKWGGTVEVVPDTDFRGLLESRQIDQAPFDDGIGLSRRTYRVVLSESYVQGNKRGRVLTSIIHELGHLFASTKPISRQYEPNQLGWELALALEVGMTFRQFLLGNHDYGFEGRELKEFAGQPEAELERRLLRDAKERGLTRRGKAIPVRIRASSNGRTRDSDSRYWGSSPCARATL